MVILVVKGTNYPDEFTLERALSDAISSSSPSDTQRNGIAGADAGSSASASSSPPALGNESIVPAVAHTLNKRHQVRLMLMSAQELVTLRLKQSCEASRSVNPSPAETVDTNQEELITDYQALIDTLYARLKDSKAPVSFDEFDAAEKRLRELTTALYPELCIHTGGAEAAVQQLYAKHEDPDLDEDTRLLVYHCRVILDPQWKENERVSETEAALWFCGKPMEGTLAAYCGRNEKSRLIVKVAPRKGPAPSTEPRMRYEDQRAMYQTMSRRREILKGLEDSELRDLVVKQARGTVSLPPNTGIACGAPGAAALSTTAEPSGSSLTLRTDRLRPICSRKEEHDLPM